MRNPLAPKGVMVQCDVCGHTWESHATTPQCSNPDSTTVDCGRSRQWSYVSERDKRAAEERLELIEDSMDENTDESTDPDDAEPSGEEPEPSGEESEPSSEDPEPSGEKPEPSSEDPEPSGEKPEPAIGDDEQMVTQREYDAAHGLHTATDSTDATDEPVSADTVTDTVPLPSVNTMAIIVVGCIAIVGLYWVMTQRRSESTDTADADTTRQQADAEATVTAGENGAEQPANLPGESPHRRDPSDIPLFEA